MSADSRIRDLLVRFQPLIALTLLVAGLGLSTDAFFTRENSLNILRQISVNLCLSLGMTFVILAGGIDLSVGSVLALAGAVAAGLLRDGLTLPAFGVHLDFTFSGAILAAILTGMLAGLVNGWTITRLRLPPFVATLGMLSIARGLTLLWTGGNPITGLGPALGVLGTGAVGGIPVPVLVVTVLAAVFWLVLRQTVFGRHLIATGSNERAAAFSGIDVRRLTLRVYVIAGVMAGLAGLILAGRLDSATPNAGISYELDCIAAVVIGGTSLSGGRGSIMGTVIGCLTIGVLNNGLVLLGVKPDWQLVIKGIVIAAAAAVDRMTNRRR